ncbi:Biopolymer transport protein exbD1 [Sterolibacterium denitrificans]|uniref:Biopolymer transport protein exbD1 n=2 Tax=Sterolibacterium denitrificans TaxID=157592 RepID=A0A7Z7MWA4_9PROT|nr:biopolymer transporter ExbD [Sterolibacterium denitrificans]KYC29371.1 biopolymer transporter ExbD [Sterolibacterium denitrificans]SMB31142.1 Biopolymer transport protein exbD1 [Sterolibacterium denitrificans]
MSFGTLTDEDGDEALTEINMIPLIDVMLVLLVIFIVAAPLLQHSVNIDLPQASSTPLTAEPEAVRLSIDAESRLYWNDAPLAEEALTARFGEMAAQSPQPQLQLAAARSTPYEKVAEVMSAAARAGLTRIGFITEPSN